MSSKEFFYLEPEGLFFLLVAINRCLEEIALKYI